MSLSLRKALPQRVSSAAAAARLALRFDGLSSLRWSPHWSPRWSPHWSSHWRSP
jgi:hypothetical protein